MSDNHDQPSRPGGESTTQSNTNTEPSVVDRIVPDSRQFLTLSFSIIPES